MSRTAAAPAPIAVEAATGAQLLPRSRPGRWAAKVLTSWLAHRACDADLRAKSAHVRDTAREIAITYRGRLQ